MADKTKIAERKEEYEKVFTTVALARLVPDVIEIIRKTRDNRNQLGYELKEHIEDNLHLIFDKNILFNSEVIVGQLNAIFINAKERFLKIFPTDMLEESLSAWGLTNPSNKGINDVQAAITVGRHAVAHNTVKHNSSDSGIIYHFEADEGTLCFKSNELQTFTNKVYDYMGIVIKCILSQGLPKDKQTDILPCASVILYSYLTINLMSKLAQASDDIDEIGDSVNDLICLFNGKSPLDYSYLNKDGSPIELIFSLLHPIILPIKEAIYNNFSKSKEKTALDYWSLNNQNNESVNTVREALGTMRNALAHCSYSYKVIDNEPLCLFESQDRKQKLFFDIKQVVCFVNKCVPYFMDIAREQLSKINKHLEIDK